MNERRLASAGVTPAHVLSQASSSLLWTTHRGWRSTCMYHYHITDQVVFIRSGADLSAPHTNMLICYCHMNVCCRSCVTWSYYVAYTKCERKRTFRGWFICHLLYFRTFSPPPCEIRKGGQNLWVQISSSEYVVSSDVLLARSHSTRWEIQPFFEASLGKGQFCPD